MYDEFFVKAHELRQQGIPFATATVVRAEKPTSGKPGDKAIITADGTMHGWIGGSCAQPTVIREALKALSSGQFRFIRLSADPDQQAARNGLDDLPMTCFSGGTLEIYIEPHYSQPRLLIIGTSQVAQSLAKLGQVMNYHILAADPDGTEKTLPETDETILSLDELEDYINANTFVVVATHGSFDEVSLEKVLRVRPTYVGLVASRKRFENVLDYLRAQGMTDEDFRPLKAPAGLDIHAQRGDEIALSIMAEIVQHRRTKVECFDLSAFEKVVEEAAARADQIAIDPVCNMEVEMATAQHTTEYEGSIYYFCCPHCKMRFEKNPGKFLQEAGAS